MFSTAQNNRGSAGSIAVINGVRMGEDVAGLPATGAWVGTQASVIVSGQFGVVTPALKGLAIIDAPAEPLVCDVPAAGAVTTTSPDLTIDYRGQPNRPIFTFTAIGPFTTGGVASSATISSLPIAGLFDPTSSPELFLLGGPIAFPVLITDANGYASITLPALWNASLVGLTLEFQGLAVTNANLLRASTPTQAHFK